MHLLSFAIVFIFVLLFANGIKFHKLGTQLKMRNFECSANESHFYNISCYFKARRGSGGILYAAAHIKHRIYRAKAHLDVYRWYNGYTPFVVNYTYDFCRVFTNKASITDRIFAKIIAVHSNINHTCPLEGAILMRGVEPDLSTVPSFLEKGRYRASLNITSPDRNNFLFGGSITAEIL